MVQTLSFHGNDYWTINIEVLGSNVGLDSMSNKYTDALLIIPRSNLSVWGSRVRTPSFTFR